MSAPTEEWRQYICRACGLIYDERLGDPDSGLAPGTRFDDIPDDWECPLCGVTKADFEPYERKAATNPAPAAMAPSRRPGIVIVGAGIAGWSVAEALRQRDSGIPVTIVTSCDGDIYHKPELSIALSRGRTPTKIRQATGGANAARLGVRLLAGTFAVRILSETNRLRTTRGTIAYSHLVLAQGARPVLADAMPPDLCWRINDLQAWSALYQTLAGGSKRIVVIGAGMVGCELSEDLARAGHRVTLLDRERAPVAEFFPPQASDRVKSGLESLGVAFLGSVNVARVIAGSDGLKRVETSDGQSFAADVVISAIGLATQSRLARTAGLAFERGIAVDPQSLRTNVSNIYGIGDCISIEGAPCRFIEPIGKQADIIAQDILGIAHGGYDHTPPVVRLKTKSAPLVMHGLPAKDGEWRVVDSNQARFAMEQWRGQDLVARLSA
ncbi:MAG: FAD-dependent oxidoreductase [Beijerinckiaceae bacterium]|nr:FAD-dependent oxidoreductase [Beijerinckiaceae bacterium]